AAIRTPRGCDGPQGYQESQLNPRLCFGAGEALTWPAKLHTRHVGGYALPAPVAKLPVIGIAAGSLGAVRLLVAGARVDDSEVAENANHHVGLADVLDGGAAADLREKGLAVDEGAVRVGVEKIGCEVGIEPGDIGFIDGADVVAIELLQHCAVF